MSQSNRRLNNVTGFAGSYLNKATTGKQFIKAPPEKDLKYIVVIPAYNESSLVESLDSLFNCNPIEADVEIITVVNCPWGCDKKTIERNLEDLETAKKWSEGRQRKNKKFHFIFIIGRDDKNSGVGFARKTGMDEAVLRFNSIDNAGGIIISLDADATVDRNYFTALEKHFSENPETSACNIYFEHPMEGHYEKDIYEAIAQYELHLRYYVQALRFAGHPNAFHTVGSCFGVKADAYCRHGGMNRKKSGEDFYFLQKIFEHGIFSECNETRVIPSPRPSDRVVFGTGPAIKKYLSEKNELGTYPPVLFEMLNPLLSYPDSLYESAYQQDDRFMKKLHPLLINFLQKNKYNEKTAEIYHNTAGKNAFIKRFFRWFNMFRAMKFLNYGKEKLGEIPVTEAALELLDQKKISYKKIMGTREILEIYRQMEKKIN